MTSSGLIPVLGDLCLLLLEDLFLLLDLLSQSHRLLIQTLLLALFVNLRILRQLYLLSQVIYGLDKIDDFLLALPAPVNELLILLSGTLHALLLLLSHLAQVLKLLLQVLQYFLLG